MANKTFVDGVALPASDLNTYLMKQSVIVCTAATHPSSPPTGMTIYETDNNALLTYNSAAWRAPWNLPWGRIASATMAASDQGSITTAGIVDVTGLTSGSFTAVANRYYVAQCEVIVWQATTIGVIELLITNGAGTVLGSAASELTPSGIGAGVRNVLAVRSAPFTLTAGAQTVKARITAESGGTVTIFNTGGAGTGRFILEDVGPSSVTGA